MPNYHITSYEVISTNALRRESDGSRMKPEPGLSKSSIKTIPPATAIEQSKSAIMAVGFAGAKSPKLLKTIASQKISRTRKGAGMLCPARISNAHRA